jgi:hypothetical protein
MEIKRDALLQVVKAARAALRLAEDFRPMLIDPRNETHADWIAWHLTEALFLMSNETLSAGQDFGKDSNTMRMLKSDNSDGAVTDWFIMMDKIRKRVSEQEPEIKQPAPQIMEADEVDKLRRQNGGVQYVWDDEAGTFRRKD